MKKKTSIWYFPLSILGIFLLTYSCKKDNQIQQLLVPVLVTSEVSSIIQNTAICGGNITSEGGSTITSRGVCWSTNTTPTIADNKTIDGAGAGSFLSTLIDLAAKTTYFVRAYATNSNGTGYGSAMSFTSHIAQAPVLSTLPVTNIKYNSATSGGNISYNGGSTITANGVCWSTKNNPTISDSKTTDAIGMVNYPGNLTGLSMNTAYYLRAYAINSAGIGYGEPILFTTASITVPVNIQIYPNTTNNIPVGGWLYLTGGNRGIIVYRLLPEEFKVYERRCPYDPDNENSIVQIDPTNKFAIDAVCGSKFTLTNGNTIQGPSTNPLQQYRWSFDSNTLLIFK